MISAMFSTDILPGIDLISTFFTLGYIVWLVSREWGFSAGNARPPVEKRSLLNQHVSNRGTVWA